KRRRRVMGERDAARDEINRIARMLMDAWAKAEPSHAVTLHHVSYIATFVDMARAVVADRGAERDALQAKLAEAVRRRASCDGSCDIALARRQVGPDGVVPGNARECAELWERE